MSRRLTPRGEQRRADLLAFATERFAAAGYHPTSVTEIVDGLGVGKGVFYWYFDSKEELFLEVLRDGQRSLRRCQQEAVGTEADPMRQLELGTKASFEWWASHRDLYHLIQFAATETAFRDSVRRGERSAANDLKRPIMEAIEQGVIPDGDAEVLAHAVLGVSAVLARTQMFGRKRPATEVADEAIAFAFGGLLGTTRDQP